MQTAAIAKQAFQSLGIRISRADRIGSDPFRDMQRLIPQPRIIFDVGANVGQSAIHFREIFPFSDVHSFEPGPAAFTELEQNTKYYAQIHRWNFGLGASNESRSFFQNSETVLSSFLEPGKDAWSRSVEPVTAQVKTVDRFCDENKVPSIDILKSDTQGFDLEVLKGAAKMMRAGKIGIVFLEVNFLQIYQGQGSLSRILDLLGENNFRLFSFYEIFRQKGLAAWTDALFVRADLSSAAE